MFDQFPVGSRVRLKAGSPEMKIDQILNGNAICVWSDADGDHSVPYEMSRLAISTDPRYIVLKSEEPSLVQNLGPYLDH